MSKKRRDDLDINAFNLDKVLYSVELRKEKREEYERVKKEKERKKKK